jgi:hypothetical protein
MTRPAPARHEPSAYQIRVVGQLDSHWSSRFGSLSLSHADDGTTVLTGPVADQAELHGLLAGIRDLGLTLVSLSVIDADTGGRA